MKRYLILAVIAGSAVCIAKPPQESVVVAPPQRQAPLLSSANGRPAAPAHPASAWHLSEPDRARLRDQLYEYRRSAK